MPTQKCAVPDCKNQAASRGKRGANSPLLGEDAHKRFKWCAYHRNGKGKGARMSFQHKALDTLIDEENANV